MRRTPVSIVICLCTAFLFIGGCMTPRHQKGGNTSMSLPALQPASISVEQPENPEGPSGMVYKEKVTVTTPEGQVTVTEREANTNVNGSQDLAKIIKEAGKSDFFKGLLSCIILGAVATVAVSRGWPLLGGILGIGSFASLFIAWWAGAIAVIAGVILFAAYQTALIQKPL